VGELVNVSSGTAAAEANKAASPGFISGVAAIAGHMTTLGAWDNALPNNGDIDDLFAMVLSRVRECWAKKS
jgi:hypothetical protein